MPLDHHAESELAQPCNLGTGGMLPRRLPSSILCVPTQKKEDSEVILLLDEWNVSERVGKKGYIVRASFSLNGVGHEPSDGDEAMYPECSSFSLNFRRSSADNLTREEILAAAKRVIAEAGILKGGA